MCAPSNVAVDSILERLVAAEAGSRSGSGGGGSSGGGVGRKNSNRLRVVRMGHPARLLPQVGMREGGRKGKRERGREGAHTYPRTFVCWLMAFLTLVRIYDKWRDSASPATLVADGWSP